MEVNRLDPSLLHTWPPQDDIYRFASQSHMVVRRSSIPTNVMMHPQAEPRNSTYIKSAMSVGTNRMNVGRSRSLPCMKAGFSLRRSRSHGSRIQSAQISPRKGSRRVSFSTEEHISTESSSESEAESEMESEESEERMRTSRSNAPERISSPAIKSNPRRRKALCTASTIAPLEQIQIRFGQINADTIRTFRGQTACTIQKQARTMLAQKGLQKLRQATLKMQAAFRRRLVGQALMPAMLVTAHVVGNNSGPSHSEDDQGKTVVWYHIEVTQMQKTWTVSRRYSEWLLLHKRMCSIFGAAADILLPGRAPCLTEELVEIRQHELNNYLQRVLFLVHSAERLYNGDPEAIVVMKRVTRLLCDFTGSKALWATFEGHLTHLLEVDSGFQPWLATFISNMMSLFDPEDPANKATGKSLSSIHPSGTPTDYGLVNFPKPKNMELVARRNSVYVEIG